MITVVEECNVVTRMCLDAEVEARSVFGNARARMVLEHWLAVSLHRVEEPPHRGAAEMVRVAELEPTLRHNV